MFLHHPSTFGRHLRHTIEHPVTGNSFSFLPSAGSILLDLTFDGKQILDTYDTPEALDELAWMKNIVLFPFPNRLDSGKYNWLGNTYFFEKNNPDTQNALHGFVFAEKFDLTNVRLTPHFGETTCQLNYNGTHHSYPFPFLLEIKFRLSTNCRFEVHFSVKNTGNTPLPMGLGWHPYFRLTENVADTELQMPIVEQVEIDARMLPTGRLSTFHDFQKFEKIEQTFLDNCFKIKNLDRKWVANLRGGGKQIEIEINNPQKWQFLQVFTPPHRRSVAIEPMTCNVDAFNSGDGLVSLDPHKTWLGSFSIQYKQEIS